MATSLTSKITLNVQATLQDLAQVLPDGGFPSYPLNYSKTWSWLSGTAIDQADRIYMKSDTVTSGAPDTHDLAGALTDILSNALTFVKVNAIILVNKSITPGEIITLGAGSAPLLNWIIATGDGNKAGPNGAIIAIDPSLAGYAVTATTGDILQVSVAAGTNVPYDIIVIGRSA